MATHSDQPADNVDARTEVRRHIDASPDQVWSVLSDGWVYPGWVVGASRIRAVDADWPAEGSRLHHSFGVWPAVIDDRTHALRAEPGRRLELRAHGWPAGAAEVVLVLEPEGTGTLVRMREDAVAGPARLVPPPLRHVLSRVRNHETLRRLAYLAEQRHGSGGGS
ncbi:MAG: SRPBCC family protein [Marmoricola sp.]